MKLRHLALAETRSFFAFPKICSAWISASVLASRSRTSLKSALTSALKTSFPMAKPKQKKGKKENGNRKKNKEKEKKRKKPSLSLASCCFPFFSKSCFKSSEISLFVRFLVSCISSNWNVLRKQQVNRPAARE